MTKDTSPDQVAALELLRSLVQDHGDAFRWSISQKGRIWLTLTHWDTEKYNTSVELDGMSLVTDMLDALAVLCVAHRAKCFQGQAHSDTWMNIDKTRSLVADAQDVVRETFVNGTAIVPGDATSKGE